MPESGRLTGAPAPARIELRASGYPELRVDGQAVPLKLKRGLALLVVLSELGRKAARSHLAELLWPDAGPEIGRTRLRRLAHEVNAVIGRELLVGDGDALWLAADGTRLSSDVAELRRAAQQALAAPGHDAAALQRLCAPQAAGLLDGFEPASDRFYLAAQIPAAELRLLPGEDHLLWAGDTAAVVDALEDFVQRRARA